MFRVVRLTPRRLAGLLLGLALLSSPLVGLAGAAPSTGSAKISAHLTKTRFTSFQAKSVKLVYRFSKPSKSTVKCWGGNRYGQLGDGVDNHNAHDLDSDDASLSPVSVAGMANADEVSTSGFSCAVLSGGKVKCWGDNSYGQLANGEPSYRPTPVRVVGIP